MTPEEAPLDLDGLALSFDADEAWLVATDSEGASEIVALGISAVWAQRFIELADLARLGVAWREAEEALPGERGLWLIQGVQLVDTSDSEDLNDEQLEWEAEAVDHQRGGQPRNVTALGPTPTAALQALAAKLREAADDPD